MHTGKQTEAEMRKNKRQHNKPKHHTRKTNTRHSANRNRGKTNKRQHIKTSAKRETDYRTQNTLYLPGSWHLNTTRRHQ